MTNALNVVRAADVRDRIADLERENTELREQVRVLDTMRYAVFPGSEQIDLGPKRMVCLCESEAQAKHMARLWAPYGYYEALNQEANRHA